MPKPRTSARYRSYMTSLAILIWIMGLALGLAAGRRP
jgi:hypothetical protein